ncbi:MAG TPA: penicillin acylase family protein [Trinickia sp.]|uniref:penicillin acylase family protein n=1 Tax=Trinickia sp. TaxID=2571163 RepID=UPI002CA126F8|nr:penicillin acylase family protein [Trinickia sp.]HTI17129.1 penicillin acylase family protein [Trinickia sp.]
MTRAVALCVAVLLSITFGGYALVRASLPPLDGTRVVSGLDAQVVIERDALGVPTLVGRTPTDLAYAMGFAHAQDRFFQMDLLRRVAAGELAALVGPSAIDTDRRHRLHRFRARAQLAAAALDSTSRHLLERYAAGVNDGLASLQSRPFEYWLLRSRPERWSVEDSLLVVYAMYFDLQYQELQRTLARAALHERVSMPLFAFLAPAASHWDAPLDQPPSATSSPPHSVNCALPPPTPDWLRATPLAPAALNRDAGSETAAMVGSNGWAVDAMHGADGHAILASDMHLGLSLPNIWYRVSVDMRDRLGSVSHRVTGVSLPGTPAIVAGSNGRIAWVFTNSYGNFIDLVELEVDPRDPSRFRMPDGHWTHASVHRESIAVRGAAPIEMDVADSPWGPLITVGAHRYAVHWIAHEAGAVDFGLEKLADADDVPGALTMGAESGIPSQNLIVVDNQGHIGWTIAGPLPRRPQTDLATMPDLPVRSDVYPGWDGFLSPAEHPRMIDPTSGRLWAANNRQLIGAEQMKIGDSGSDVGARATQIRDTLLAHERMSERDMLALQTDDRALWIEPWRRLALDALDDAAIEARPQRAQYRRLVEQWNGRADVDAVGYTLLRAFYTALYDAWFGKLDAELAQVHPGLGYRVATSRSLAVMETLTRCHAWVPPGFIDWHAFILERIDRAIGALTQDGMPLQAARWGEHNRAAIAHPFAHTMAAHVPLLDSLLSAPNEPLPGDKHMPRVQAPSFGASERMVVSAGHEAQAILTMPGGQSGNPASPYFLAGHDHWVHGDASPLLPGPSVHRLQLIPEKRP